MDRSFAIVPSGCTNKLRFKCEDPTNFDDLLLPQVSSCFALGQTRKYPCTREKEIMTCRDSLSIGKGRVGWGMKRLVFLQLLIESITSR